MGCEVLFVSTLQTKQHCTLHCCDSRRGRVSISSRLTLRAPPGRTKDACATAASSTGASSSRSGVVRLDLSSKRCIIIQRPVQDGRSDDCDGTGFVSVSILKNQLNMLFLSRCSQLKSVSLTKALLRAALSAARLIRCRLILRVYHLPSTPPFDASVSPLAQHAYSQDKHLNHYISSSMSRFYERRWMQVGYSSALNDRVQHGMG